MQNARILIVDDHKNVLNALGQILSDEFSDIITSSNPNLIPEIISKNKIDVVLLDMNFNAGLNTGNEGIFWLNKIKETDDSIMVILITAYGDVNLAVEAMKQGASDFILKPWDNDKLIITVNNVLKLKYSNEKIKSLEDKQDHLNEMITKSIDPLIGESQSFKQIQNIISKVAKTDANILIFGENGTGKELVAREIHKQSKRNNYSLVSIDVGILPDTLFESELFGYKKGAFTDAKEDRTGKIKVAENGTLFLDEISNLSYSNQAKLLTVLQQKSVNPVGSSQSHPVDFRLICATNKDLKQLLIENLFREDLLYRINTIQIDIPPLRERREDIPLLADYFLSFYKKKYDKVSLKISNDANEQLMRYYWPGNIRELKHTIEKAIILSESSILRSSDFLLDGPIISTFSKAYPKKLDEVEKDAILSALGNNNGNIKETAKELGIARQTLYNKMQKYNL